MVRPRPRRGERRIDAAIDHLAGYGFPKPNIRKTINNLLQLYGRDGWVFLEEGSYRVVLEKLLEDQQEEQGQKQKQQIAAEDEASPEDDMQISQEHIEAPTASNTVPEKAKPLGSPDKPLAPEPIPPLPPAPGPIQTLPPASDTAPIRPPCYGWISESETESESGSEEMHSDKQKEVNVPSPIFEKNVPRPVESLPSRRKRPSRWDVRHNWQVPDIEVPRQ
ncbi:hypothetical protein ACP70R_022530 [Stipagrostis hirtigluma subsp. patula]